MDSLKCQTVAATPAEPGDLPYWFRPYSLCLRLVALIARRRPARSPSCSPTSKAAPGYGRSSKRRCSRHWRDTMRSCVTPSRRTVGIWLRPPATVRLRRLQWRQMPSLRVSPHSVRCRLMLGMGCTSGPEWPCTAGQLNSADGDYHGPALNRAARLMAAGHGGQILLSLATEELVRDHLPPGVALRDMGERRLKDLIRPERVYQVIAPDLPADIPAAQDPRRSVPTTCRRRPRP